jgi:hypothetical protein
MKPVAYAIGFAIYWKDRSTANLLFCHNSSFHYSCTAAPENIPFSFMQYIPNSYAQSGSNRWVGSVSVSRNMITAIPKNVQLALRAPVFGQYGSAHFL